MRALTDLATLLHCCGVESLARLHLKASIMLFKNLITENEGSAVLRDCLSLFNNTREKNSTYPSKFCDRRHEGGPCQVSTRILGFLIFECSFAESASACFVFGLRTKSQCSQPCILCVYVYIYKAIHEIRVRGSLTNHIPPLVVNVSLVTLRACVINRNSFVVSQLLSSVLINLSAKVFF